MRNSKRDQVGGLRYNLVCHSKAIFHISSICTGSKFCCKKNVSLFFLRFSGSNFFQVLRIQPRGESQGGSWAVFMYTESVMPSNHLILSCPLLLLPSIFASMRVFSNELTIYIRWPKYWIFSISPSNKYSGLISFWIGWFDLLSIQGTLKSLLQHHSLKASILQHLVFFMFQLSQPYMTIGKTIALTIQTFVDKVMSRFLICYLGFPYLFFQGARVF